MVEESGLATSDFAFAKMGRIFGACELAPRTEAGSVDSDRLPALCGVGSEEIPLVPRPENELQARDAFSTLLRRVRAERLLVGMKQLMDLPDGADRDVRLAEQLTTLVTENPIEPSEMALVSSRELAERAAAREGEILANARPPHLSVGIKPIDLWCGGLGPGELTTIAGEANSSKSALAMDMARRVAESGLHSLFLSCEMTEEQVGDRELWSAVGVPMRSEKLDQEKIDRALRNLDSYGASDRVLVLHRPRMSKAQVVSSIKRQLGKEGVGLVVFDHLGRWDTGQPPGTSEYEHMTEAIQQVKDVALSLRVPILLLTHLNRSRAGHTEPTMTMVRGSGRVEDTTDNLLLLWRDDKQEGDLFLKVAKTRQGSGRGRIARLTFHASWGRFNATMEVK